VNAATIVQRRWYYCSALRDETLADSDKLPPPDVIAQEIVDDLKAALEQFRLIANDLGTAA
jgi:hypothetical protein